ncbi:hypothetical protein GCM10027037_22800 [Mucilaginibacter koreensis]
MPLQEFKLAAGEHRFVPLLQQMLQYIRQHIILPDAATEQLLFEAKVVLTELLTNGIKHSGGQVTCLRIEIEKNSICFVKKDSGRAMALLQHPQLCKPGDTTCITHDALHALHASLTAPQRISFTCTKHDWNVSIPDYHQLPEHFGLLIIAKVADEFGYEYKEGENVFVVRKGF